MTFTNNLKLLKNLAEIYIVDDVDNYRVSLNNEYYKYPDLNKLQDIIKLLSGDIK